MLDVPNPVERLLKVFPGLLAGAVAVVYVLGAVATGSEFDGAGIDPRDAVPLLSIDQILARGIGLLVAPAFAVGALSVVIGGGVLLFMVARAELGGGNGTLDTAVASSWRPFWAGMVASSLLLTPLNQLPGFLVALVGGFTAGFAAAHLPDDWKGLKPVFVGLVLVAIVLGFGVNAYTDPAPISKAELELANSHSTVRGRLITHSDATWYIFDSSEDRVRGYSDGAVSAATVFKRPSGASNNDPSFLDYARSGLSSITGR